MADHAYYSGNRSLTEIVQKAKVEEITLQYHYKHVAEDVCLFVF